MASKAQYDLKNKKEIIHNKIVVMNFLLPQELQDKIFLYLDYKTLKNCRELQSEFVKCITQYNNFVDAAKNKNLKNMKWLKDQGVLWEENENIIFFYAGINGDLQMLKWLKEQGCPLPPLFSLLQLKTEI